MIPIEAVQALREIVGVANVIGPCRDQSAYLVDWRGRYHGQALAIVKPGSVLEVAEVVRWCDRNDIAITPQGGNTGMCGAATPLGDREQIVIRLDRMNRIRWTSELGDAIAVDAGCILQNVQQAAEAVGALFPMSLGAEGSCQIGGNLSTNAGGTAVLRYGTMRELTLGLEIVLPNGDLLNSMTALRKDSTGYDLKQLFIGAEGTLGIITGAVLKLFPRPKGRAVAMAKLVDIDHALAVLALARSTLGERLGSFEIMSRGQLEVIAENVDHVSIPFALDTDWCLLIELVDTLEGQDLSAMLEGLLAEAFEKELVTDAIVASSETQAETLWAIRHSVSEGSKRAGYVISHDSAVPLDAQGAFVRRVTARIAEARPDARIAMHGHIGDGNIHVLAIIPGVAPDSADAMREAVATVNAIVDEETAALRGSISAEHGIGVSNRERLARVADPLELEWMARVKALFDPKGLMNPGKVISAKAPKESSAAA